MTVRAELTDSFTDWLLDEHGEVKMQQPTKKEFEELVFEYERRKSFIFNPAELAQIRRNMDWVYKDINPTEPPAEQRIKLKDLK